ncbi:carbohydrate kinase [Planosporangium flavigriseum]|uniref:ATP:glycerol 3-phosphotransferase n=1 Tax=Planosporangium flavigriseum TaxID=373681 RepID=A0A8J3PNC6_9ACTN|nr:FGGY family carbohydrate kinase [Planosporangium flavigriseum]NJC65455.1 carbohydrate kinase [Planosporangium flavigriseum]GIG75857.1 carbohydrate kinase [Planosporangium flavigriseum]
MTVLAIDQGTSGTKAIVVDQAGKVLSIAEETVRPAYLPGGGVEQEPADLLASVLDAGRRAIALAGRPVEAVSIANQGETVLAWDPRTGQPLSPAIVWQDRRAEPLCAELSTHRDSVAQKTGLVLDPYFSAPKMAWLRRNVTADGVVTTTDTWLVHRLTGEFVTDVSTASRSLLLDLDAVDWDPELLDLFGLAGEALPRIVACDEIVGSTTAFGSTMKVGGLVVDQQAALLAESCLEPGTAKCTFGTGAFLLANTGPTAVRSTSGLTTSVAWRARGETPYCVDGQVYTAASAVRWLQDLGFVGSAADLDRVAAADPQGVLCVPSLAGLAAPWWRPDATATFTGMTLSTRPEHLVLAVLQGIAAQVAEIGALVEKDLGQPLTRLRVDGGLTRSRTLMQATADLMQIPIDVYPSTHATALGAATLARLSVHPQLTVAEAVPAWVPETTYEPAWSLDRASEHRARWRAAVAAALPQE